MTEKKLSIQSSIMWNACGSICYLGCQWLLTVLVVRISGLADAGMLSLAMSVCNIWYSIALYGIRNFQVSDTIEKYSDRVYILSRLITGSMGLVGCVVYIFVVSYDTMQRICILLYYFFKFSEALHDVYAGIFQKNWRLDYAGKSLFIRSVLSLLSFVIMLYVTGNLALTIGSMAGVCLVAVLLYDMPIAKKMEVFNCAHGRDIKKLLIECFPLVIYTLFATSIATIPRLIMERELGSYQLGIYSSIATPTLIIQMGATYVFNPYITLFAERYHQRDKKGFIAILRKCIAAVILLAAVGLLGGKVLGKWGLNLLYGEAVAKYVDLLLPLIVCTILTGFSWLLSGVLTSVRAFKALVGGNLLAVILSAILSLCFIRNWGMQGASIALAIALLAEIVVLFVCIVKIVKKQFE